ncbi:MAG TPA: LPS assembly protein LptD [Syntrophorhabdales bacterium]|nr:LPS assembly protein LptD [Syntrophorhabdales bacterium]
MIRYFDASTRWRTITWLGHTILWLAVILLMPFSSEARELAKRTTNAPVDITADFLQYDKNQNMYIAKGNVEMRQGTATLTADYVEYHEDSADALAEGNVVLQDNEGTIRTERMTLNMVTQQGTIEKGDIYIKQGNFYLIGDEIKKTGEATYVIQRGKFTTCGWDKPAWTFAAKDINLTAQGYATASNAKFSIRDNPVFFLPWGVFPVKTERQSGFLLPELIKSSRDGYRLTESYYWAISKDTDATFGAQWIQDRGVRALGEYRYFVSPELKGQWGASIIDDQEFHHTRWNIVGEHVQAVNNSLTLKARVYQVSDQDFLKDFGLTTLQRAENSVSSTVFAEQFMKKSLLTAETTYFRTLVVEDNKQTFQYLPFVSFFTEHLPLLNSSIYANASSSVTNFSREQGTTYARFSAAPALSMPFHFQGFNLLASNTFIQRAYSINQKGLADVSPVPDEKTSNYFQTIMLQGDANFQAYRNYKTDLFGLDNLQSVIKPRVTYTFIPATDTVTLPIVNPFDQIVKTNTITYSFNHYLNAVGKTSSREISLLEIDQTYGLSGDLPPSTSYIIGNGDNTGPGRRFSDVHARLTLYPVSTFFFTEEAYIDPYSVEAKILRTSLGVNRPTFSSSVTHTYQQGTIDQILWIATGRFWNFDGRISIRYDLMDNTWIDTLYGLTYHPGCWALNLILLQTRRPPDTSIHFTFSLAGLTSRGQPMEPVGPLSGPTPSPTPASSRGISGLQQQLF